MDEYKQLDLFPQFESESSSLAIKLFSDICCNGCTCKNDHEFVLEEIDFEQ